MHSENARAQAYFGIGLFSHWLIYVSSVTHLEKSWNISNSSWAEAEAYH